MNSRQMAAFKKRLAELAGLVDDFLGTCLRGRDVPEDLLSAMEYSLLAGGKRLRPVLCLSFAGLFGASYDAVISFAAGLELIHTYSLIHDDLPAMDNDDLRRGKPSNHKVYGEAMAILAGDGLLTEAFGLMLSSANGPAPELVVRAAMAAAEAAGASGMVGGQTVDMGFTGQPDIGLDRLRVMHAMKTGALIRGACVSGAILAGAGKEDVSRAATYGAELGLAFQIVDDILDEIGDEKTLGKPVGSDKDKGKVTYPSLLGLDESKRLAEQARDRALDALLGYDSKDAEFLGNLAEYVIIRVNWQCLQFIRH